MLNLSGLPTRQPAVAGAFYPADPDRLIAMIENFAQGDVKVSDVVNLKALIAPHAGYIYSGPIAGKAYSLLQTADKIFKTVLLIGPAHTQPIAGLAAPRTTGFETPLGIVPCATDLLEELEETFPFVVFDDAPHLQEHCLEVQLPFLQHFLAEFRIVPLVAGETSGNQVAQVIRFLSERPTTLTIISSDLSHYLPYELARDKDAQTAEAIENLTWQELDWEAACGRIPIQGLLQVAQEKEWLARREDLRNSGDTAGPHSQVVGYGAWSFWEQ